MWGGGIRGKIKISVGASAKKLIHVRGGRRKKQNMYGGVSKKIKLCEGGVRKIVHSAPPPQDLKWNSPNPFHGPYFLGVKL